MPTVRRGGIDDPKTLSVWGSRYFESLSSHELFFDIEPRPLPSNLNLSDGLKPVWFRDEISRRNIAKQKKWQTALLSLGLATFVIIGLLLLTLNFLENRKLKKELALLSPSAERVISIQNRWNEIATAVDPQHSYLETWRHLFSLPAIQKVELSRLDIAREGMAISGNSRSAKLALQFIEEVTSSVELGNFYWDYNPPEIDGSGSATFELKGTR